MISLRFSALAVIAILTAGVGVAHPYQISQAIGPVVSEGYSNYNQPSGSTFLGYQDTSRPSKTLSAGAHGKSHSSRDKVRGIDKDLEEIDDSLEELNESLKEGKDYSDTLRHLKQKKYDILTRDKKIRSEFNETEKVLKKLLSHDKISEKILERYRNVTSNYSRSMNELLAEIEDIEKSEDREKVEKELADLDRKLEELRHEEKEKFLSSEQLPHRLVNREAEVRTLGESLLPSYSFGAVNVSGSNISSKPTSADLTPTPDARITPEIEHLAEMHSNDPVKLYGYVRNSIDYRPYYGSKKGSHQTLWEKAGNSFDQASLLISLYRSAGIPARYSYGIMEMPIEDAINLTGITDPRTAANAFASAGVPTTLVVEGGEYSALLLEHAWVEAYLPYGNYRGKIKGEGGYQWVPLDPSFKQYEYHEPAVNLTQAMGVNATEFLNGIMNQSTINESGGYITSMNQSYIQQQMELYTNSTMDYLNQSNMSNATLNDLLGYREIMPEHLGILPNSLPYRVVEKKAVYSQLPDNLRHRLRFELPGNSTTLAMPELAGKRITLSYVPATESDNALIEEYGGITEVPAYLVKMKPVLMVEGEAMLTGRAKTLGKTQRFVMEFITPGGWKRQSGK